MAAALQIFSFNSSCSNWLELDNHTHRFLVLRDIIIISTNSLVLRGIIIIPTNSLVLRNIVIVPTKSWVLRHIIIIP
jgi:hypothetical protein